MCGSVARSRGWRRWRRCQLTKAAPSQLSSARFSVLLLLCCCCCCSFLACWELCVRGSRRTFSCVRQLSWAWQKKNKTKDPSLMFLNVRIVADVFVCLQLGEFSWLRTSVLLPTTGNESTFAVPLPAPLPSARGGLHQKQHTDDEDLK